MWLTDLNPARFWLKAHRWYRGHALLTSFRSRILMHTAVSGWHFILGVKSHPPPLPTHAPTTMGLPNFPQRNNTFLARNLRSRLWSYTFVFPLSIASWPPTNSLWVRSQSRISAEQNACAAHCAGIDGLLDHHTTQLWLFEQLSVFNIYVSI